MGLTEEALEESAGDVTAALVRRSPLPPRFALGEIPVMFRFHHGLRCRAEVEALLIAGSSRR